MLRSEIAYIQSMLLIACNYPVWERLLEKKGQVETFRQISSMM
jgi:hypothetical protein